jgi:uncharacterized damage-inducible protein DinB
MEAHRVFEQLFEYDYWGNRESLASLNTVSGDTGRARRILNHIIGAQRIWLARFETLDAKSAEPWPDSKLEECRAAIEELHKSWTGLLRKLRPERLDEKLVYRNTKGVEFKTPVRDVLLHFVMHSAYHRGQVAAAVREAGGIPAATDYVVYVRQHEKAF